MNYTAQTHHIQCPYCWETFQTIIDGSEVMEAEESSYTEDCYVCCRPIVLTISEGEDGELNIAVEAELG